MTERPKTPMLDRVTLPSDLKALSDRDLRQLADELRAETISAVSFLKLSIMSIAILIFSASLLTS